MGDKGVGVGSFRAALLLSVSLVGNDLSTARKDTGSFVYSLSLK